ncbi:MAG: glycosyltransferase family 2 protein [Candidatus Paceibacterota bacterium]
MLSVVIPSYKDPLLQKTIDSLLENSELGDKMEIIAVLDGYWPSPQLRDDKRLKILHLGKNRGMRGAINAGVAISKGDYIMKSDAHCMFGKGYDRILLERIRDNWIVTPRRYFLDTEKWEVINNILPVDYKKLVIDQDKFARQEWQSRAEERKDKMIDDTMVIQESCWVMARSWWDKVIRELQTDDDGTIEIAMKTFVAGGRTMVNKNTWYAHKHRKFGRTSHVSGEEIKKGNDYVLSRWKDELVKMNQYFGI